MPGLVRKIAWSGDGRRGAVRLEVGAGALSGATVLVQVAGGQVNVTIRTTDPAGGQAHSEVEAWRERIAARLEARGLDVGAVEIG